MDDIHCLRILLLDLETFACCWLLIFNCSTTFANASGFTPISHKSVNICNCSLVNPVFKICDISNRTNNAVVYQAINQRIRTTLKRRSEQTFHCGLLVIHISDSKRVSRCHVVWREDELHKCFVECCPNISSFACEMDKLYKLAHIPNKGRGLIALQPLPKGQLLFAERPIVSCLREETLGQYCSYCFNPLTDSERDGQSFDTFHVDCQDIGWKTLVPELCGSRNRDCTFLYD